MSVAVASIPAAVCSQRWASSLAEMFPPESPPLPTGKQLLCEAERRREGGECRKESSWLGLGEGELLVRVGGRRAPG